MNGLLKYISDAKKFKASKINIKFQFCIFVISKQEDEKNRVHTVSFISVTMEFNPIVFTISRQNYTQK